MKTINVSKTHLLSVPCVCISPTPLIGPCGDKNLSDAVLAQVALGQSNSTASMTVTPVWLFELDF